MTETEFLDAARRYPLFGNYRTIVKIVAPG
jgi:hypothetical protein